MGNVAIKVRIYPTKEQEQYIARLLGCDRFVHNKVIEFKQAQFLLTGKTPSWKECGAYFTSLRNSEEFSFLKDVHTHPLHQAVIDVERAYSNYFENIAEKPNFKSRHDKQTCRFPATAFSGISGNRLTLIKRLNNIHFKCSRRDEIYLNKCQARIKSATLEKKKSGEYSLSILVNREKIKQLPKTDKVVGIDIGIKDFVVTSDGERFENRKPIRSNEKKLKKLQRHHSKKQKGSKNKEKARKKLARFHEKLHNQQDYYLHQISNKLLNENQVVVFETLNIQGMMGNHRLAKAIGELSASKLITMTEYKANWYGRDFVKIGQFYPSTKLCEDCGFKNDDLTLSDRAWICPGCGVEHDRDLNAACNIRNEGVRLLKSRKGQPSTVKTLTKRIGVRKLTKDLSAIEDSPHLSSTDGLPACSRDVKLVEKTIETSMKQEKNVTIELEAT